MKLPSGPPIMLAEKEVKKMCRYKSIYNGKCENTYSPYYGKKCNDFLEAVCIYRCKIDSGKIIK
ncbi:MAG TPA: hypothetical protein EYH56_00925 [Nanoarchaeota archaeon]|nr:hypothetical protein [Nanoarchaeota archaeon]